MKRKKLLFIGLTAVVLCVGGIALAKAVTVDLMPVPLDDPVDPDASGQAVLSYSKGLDKTVVQVNCLGLEPATEYTVYLKDVRWYPIGTFTTRKNGGGNLHVLASTTRYGDVSGHLPVAVMHPEDDTVLLGP